MLDQFKWDQAPNHHCEGLNSPGVTVRVCLRVLVSRLSPLFLGLSLCFLSVPPASAKDKSPGRLVSEERPLEDKFKTIQQEGEGDSSAINNADDQPLPGPPEKVDAKTVNSLRGDFKKALELEQGEFKKEQAREVKDLHNADRIKVRNWEKQEREERHRYFEKNKHGPERREYIKEFLIRRDALHASGIEEEKTLRDRQEIRSHAFVEEQRERLKEFEEFLGKGERPPMILWKK